MDERSLQRLFRRYQRRRDGRALASVFDATAPSLLALARRLARQPAEAEDLVQAVFLTAIGKAQRYDGSLPVQAWLYGILWREAAKSRRRAARAPDPRSLAEREAPDPLEASAAAELPAAVEEALRSLPPHYAQVLRPLLLEEKRPEHIARELARPAATVRSQIHRGLAQLRRRLAPGWAAPGALALPPGALLRVRANVLQGAGFPPATAGLSSLSMLALGAGGLLVTKTALVAAALVVGLGTTWLVLDGFAQEAPSIAAEPSSAPNAAPAVALGAASVAPSALSAPADAASEARDDAARPASAPAERPFEEELAYWLGRYGEDPESWRHGWAVTQELAALPPARARALMEALWPRLSVPVKEQALKPFVFDGGHPEALAILHLAATDATPSVQSRAFHYLQQYAFRDFALDYEGYVAWAERMRGRPVADVLRESARELVDELASLPSSELGPRLLQLQRPDLRAGPKAGLDLAAELRERGLGRVLETALASEDGDLVRRALEWSKAAELDETWLRTWVLPVIQAGEHAQLSAYMEALARPDCVWARDALLAHLRKADAREHGNARQAARALAEMRDPAAIPALIEILLADTDGSLRYDVGHFGLAELTGVRWEEGYDGEWWARWWAKNRARFGPELAGVELRR